MARADAAARAMVHLPVRQPAGACAHPLAGALAAPQHLHRRAEPEPRVSREPQLDPGFVRQLMRELRTS
ncbi:hypothetical protein PLANTIT3_40103 [Plantibacter sp. T3]|nr:hypothetical protein PLANTIT3_40103 [Plantibacter sp. T3]